MDGVREIDLHGYTVAEAARRLADEVATARRTGQKYVRVIHGTGSGGPNGSIKDAAEGELRRLGARGVIRGEDFNSSNDTARTLIKEFPKLRNFPDFNRNNTGVTLAVL